MSLSTFFVVKDEAPTMLRALESVLSVTDQYVIGIDDKSTDGTRERVEQFRDAHPEKEFDIYSFTWENHFANTRNEAISRCTKDWIFQLDGHEYLYRGSVEAMRMHMERAPEDIWLISVRMHLEPIWTTGAKTYIPEVFFLQAHLWRNNKGIAYEHASHNQITKNTCPIENRMNTPDIIIIHDRPPENAERRRKQRHDMNKPHFESRRKIDKTDERGLFYGVMTYVDAAVVRQEDGTPKYKKSMLRKAIPLARKYLKYHGDKMPEQAFEMASKLGEVSRELSMIKEAREAFVAALDLQPQRAEAYYNLGLLAVDKMEQLGSESNQKKGHERRNADNELFHLFKAAERWFMLAENASIPVTSYFLRGPMYDFLPLLKRAELYRSVYYYTRNEEHYHSALNAYYTLAKKLPGNIDVKHVIDELTRIYRAALRTPYAEDDKKRVLIVNTTGQFTDDLAKELHGAGYEVGVVNKTDEKSAVISDYILSSWADNNAVLLSHQTYAAPQFVRLCRYEAYSDFPNRINWNGVTGLIVPSETMKRYVTDRYSISCPVHVINHGLDLDRYSYKKRAHGQNVAFVGYIHARKNLQELADIIIAAKDKHFHIAGKVQAQDLWRYFWWRLRKSGCADRVTYHGWQDDIDTWLDDIDANYMLSTSWSESFGYAIAETMAKGIMPVVREFEGADELWPKWCLFNNIEGALTRMNPAVDYRDSKLTRQWVQERYNVVDEAAKYLELFEAAKDKADGKD